MEAYPKFLPTDFSHRVTVSDEEIAAENLTDEEFDALIEKEQAEADAWAAAHASAKSRYRVKYSEDQPRDSDGRFASGGGLASEAAALNSGKEITGPLADAVAARTGVGGYTYDMHQLIVQAIEAAPANAPELYRGFAMNSDNGWTFEDVKAFTDGLTPGAEIGMRLGSYSESHDIIENFAGVDENNQAVGGADPRAYTPTGTFIQSDDPRVVLTVTPGAQALNAQPVAAYDYEYQREWITTGTFSVDSVQHDGVVWNVHLTQKDTEEPAMDEATQGGRWMNE